MAFPEYISDTVDNLNVSLYLTTIEEIYRLYSLTGETLHTDDLNPTDPNYNSDNPAGVSRANFLTELCQRATSHVMSYLAPRYTIQAIYRNPRLREIATYWACYKLSRRRGNEPVYEQEYIENEEDLTRYRLGELYLDAPSNGQRAYVQSYVTDMRFSNHACRVLPTSSTSIIAGQQVQLRYGFAWL
jgi:hypothetical protein